MEKQKQLRKDSDKVVSKTFFDSRIKPNLEDRFDLPNSHSFHVSICNASKNDIWLILKFHMSIERY